MYFAYHHNFLVWCSRRISERQFPSCFDPDQQPGLPHRRWRERNAARPRRVDGRCRRRRRVEESSLRHDGEARGEQEVHSGLQRNAGRNANANPNIFGSCWKNKVLHKNFVIGKPEDLTEKQSGSKRCQFQGCPNRFHLVCIFTKPNICGTAAFATGWPNPIGRTKKQGVRKFGTPWNWQRFYHFASQLNPLWQTQSSVRG